MAGFTLDPRNVGDGTFLRLSNKMYIKLFARGSPIFTFSLFRDALHANLRVCQTHHKEGVGVNNNGWDDEHIDFLRHGLPALSSSSFRATSEVA